MFNGLTDAKVNALLNDAKQKAANPGTNENERAMAVAIWELAEEVSETAYYTLGFTSNLMVRAG